MNNLRTNQRRLPAGLARRNFPRPTLAELEARSVAFRSLRTAIRKPGPRQPRIVSSAHGPLRHLLFAYPSYAAGEYSYRDLYADLFGKLPRQTRLTILCHPSASGDLKKALSTARVTRRATIVEAPEYLSFLVWAEDPFVVVHDISTSPRTIFFVEPFTFPRAGDAVISDLVAEATPLQNTQSPLYFQGGNVLIGDDFILLGADYPANTLALIERHQHILVPSGTDPATFVHDLYRKTFDPERALHYLGTRLTVPQDQTRPVTVNGENWTEEIYAGTGTAQPIFHIDMFISLAGRNARGKYRLLVGSPALADQLLGRASVPHAMSEIFDDVARNLKRLGFDVIRNPLPLTYVDDAENKVRMWYFATSNNCLVQIDKRRGNVVWLPTYGHGDWAELAATDEANKRVWEKLGFTVHQLGDFHPFAQNLGSVHCIKKYLER